MPFYTGLRFAQTWREGHLAFHSTYAGTQQCVPVFVAEKSSLGRGTGWNFRTLVDMPPAHAGLQVDGKPQNGIMITGTSKEAFQCGKENG